MYLIYIVLFTNFLNDYFQLQYKKWHFIRGYKILRFRPRKGKWRNCPSFFVLRYTIRKLITLTQEWWHTCLYIFGYWILLNTKSYIYLYICFSDSMWVFFTLWETLGLFYYQVLNTRRVVCFFPFIKANDYKIDICCFSAEHGNYVEGTKNGCLTADCRLRSESNTIANVVSKYTP